MKTTTQEMAERIEAEEIIEWVDAYNDAKERAMRDDKLRKTEATEGGIHMEEAVYAMTNGEPESLAGMSAEEIESTWNDCGESLLWDAEDIVEYVETLNG